VPAHFRRKALLFFGEHFLQLSHPCCLQPPLAYPPSAPTCCLPCCLFVSLSLSLHGSLSLSLSLSLLIPILAFLFWGLFCCLYLSTNPGITGSGSLLPLMGLGPSCILLPCFAFARSFGTNLGKTTSVALISVKFGSPRFQRI